jgi:hypothetical protein
MTTAELVIEKTHELVRAQAADDEAVPQILECCGAKRVSVVVARHHFLERLEANPQDGEATRGAELLTLALDRGDWTLTEDVEYTS